jgi:hypothetical protein
MPLASLFRSVTQFFPRLLGTKSERAPHVYAMLVPRSGKTLALASMSVAYPSANELNGRDPPI